MATSRRDAQISSPLERPVKRDSRLVVCAQIVSKNQISRIDDVRLVEIFAREVLEFLVRKELLSPEWAERILSWPHTGFNVHSLVRTKTKPEAERVGKYMIRPVLSLDRLSFLEQEGKVGYRHGQNGAELETMDYLELIARVTSHISDKGQVMVR